MKQQSKQPIPAHYQRPNDLDLSRRYFYKAVDAKGRPFVQSRHDMTENPVTYEVGKEVTPLKTDTRFATPLICSAEAVHGSDTPEGAITWAAGMMLNATHYGPLFDVPFVQAVSDAHPYGIRLFSFRGTPFAAREQGPFQEHGTKAHKYGFTRIKPERELDVAKYFERPSPLTKVPALDDLFDEYLSFYERVTDGWLSARKSGGHVWRDVDAAANGRQRAEDSAYDYWYGHVRRDDTFDDLLSMVAMRMLRQRLNELHSVCHVSSLQKGTRYTEYRKVRTRLLKKYNYQPQGSNDYFVSRLAFGLFEDYIAHTVMGIPRDGAMEDIAAITRERGRAIVIEVPSVTSKSPEYRRAMSLQRKIQNMIEKEYGDLAGATVSSMQV